MEFTLNGGYCREGRLLYIPYWVKGSEGYLCVDGLGIPLGCKSLSNTGKQFWFGSEEFSWQESKLGSMVTVDLIPATVSNSMLARFVVSHLGKPVLSCTAWYKLSLKQFKFTSFLVDGGLVHGNLYQVPAEKLAKLYILF